MFISFEGGEGTGKTTQINRIAEVLKLRGCECVLTREPGSTRIGKRIRALLLDPDHTEIHYLTELLLYMADRAQHIHEIILPALAQGKVVLCDRYVDATLAYQGYGRGMDIGLIRRLHREILDNLMPDITFLLDMDPEPGLKRAWKQIQTGDRTGKETRFEQEALQFHHKVRNGYLDLARQAPDRFRIINAALDEKTVTQEILSCLEAVWEPYQVHRVR